MRYILGIDSGGTKSEAMLVHEDGTVVGWGRSTPTEFGRAVFTFHGNGRTRNAVSTAVRKALGNTRFDELLVAGVATVHSLAFLTESFPARVELHLAGEFSSAFALVGEPCGIVALAGTGSFVHGLTRDGRVVHLDGLGPWLGDHGSGYRIGYQAFRAAARSGWHPRHRTSLAGRIYRVCGLKREDPLGGALIRHMLPDRDRSEVASLARIVDEEAEAGDRVAREILEAAASGLAETIYDVVQWLGMDGEDYALVGTGGVAAKSRIYWEHLCTRVHEFAPRLRPVRSDLPAVVGVVLTALRKLHPHDLEPVRQRLCEGTRAWLRSREQPAASPPVN